MLITNPIISTLKEFLPIALLGVLFSCQNAEQSSQDQNMGDAHEILSTLVERANDFYQKEEYSKAKLFYDTLISIDSTKGVYYFKRAYCKSALSPDGSDSSVIPDYFKAIKLNYERKQSAYLNIAIEHRFRAVFRSKTAEAKKAGYAPPCTSTANA